MSIDQIITSISIPLTVACILGIGRWVKRAIRRELKDVITETVQPQIEAIHQRIDDHMDEEEAGLLVLAEVLAELGGLDVDQVRGRIERRKGNAA